MMRRGIQAAWAAAIVVVLAGGLRAEPATPAATGALSVAEAERLAAAEGDVHVPGHSLDVEAARRLAEHTGGRLIFDDLTDLPAAVAEALALHRGGLVFTTLAKLDAAAARALALEGAGELRLPALVAPSGQTLRELAAFDGPLVLDGVRSLPLNVAEDLKARRRKTSLRGVVTIGATRTTWAAWAGTGAAQDGGERADRDGSDFDGEDDDPDEDDIPGEKSRRGRRAGGGDTDEDDADGDEDDPDDDSGVIGDDG
jgi:hypothetical protein